jgi:phenylacetate-CoA ligase
MTMNSMLRRLTLQLHEKATGRRILSRLQELNRTQWMSGDELQALQQAKLQRVVDYAYQYVPYYRRLFDSLGFLPDDLRRNPDAILKLPLLTKNVIRENWEEMLTTEPKRRRELKRLSTSGSTGEPLVFLQDSDFRDYVTADINRHLGWAGWQLGGIHAFIWAIPLQRTFADSMRCRLIDVTWNRFLINACNMTEAGMTSFADEILRRKPRVLMGYATAVHRFAHFVRSCGKYDGITFDGIFTSAEMLLPAVRAFLEETFHCRVFNRYGTLELGGVGCECEAHTGLHLSVEGNYLEILRDGKPVRGTETGDIVVTNLSNLGMPFIRYRVGDAGSWYRGGDCPCGRQAPMLSSLDGRVVDSFKTRDGHTVWAGFAGAAFRCLNDPSIKQFQVIQKTLDDMVVRIVSSGEVPPRLTDEITNSIRNTFGDNVKVGFEFPDQIAPLPSGKHRYATSEVAE